MESNTIPFYEKFGVLSVMMPYYNPTHECFLLLSRLCKGSRQTLMQWYEEFNKVMLCYCDTFYFEYFSEDTFPPCDLFKFDFENYVQSIK